MVFQSVHAQARLVLACLFVLLFSLTACGDNDNDDQGKDTPHIDLPQTFTAPTDTLSFKLPADWTAQMSSDEDETDALIVNFTNTADASQVDELIDDIGDALDDSETTLTDDDGALVNLDTLLVGMVQVMPDKSGMGFAAPNEILEELVALLEGKAEIEAIRTLKVDGQNAARVTLRAEMNSNTLSMLFVLIEYPSVYAVIQFMATESLFDAQRATLDAVVASLHLDPALAGEPLDQSVDLRAATAIPPAEVSQTANHSLGTFRLPENWVSMRGGNSEEYLVFSSAEVKDAIDSGLYGREIHLATLLEMLVIAEEGTPMPDHRNAVVGIVGLMELDMENTGDRLASNMSPEELLRQVLAQPDYPTYDTISEFETEDGHPGIYSFSTQQGREANTDVRVMLAIIKFDGAFGVINFVFFPEDYETLAPLLAGIVQSVHYDPHTVQTIPTDPPRVVVSTISPTELTLTALAATASSLAITPIATPLPVEPVIVETPAVIVIVATSTAQPITPTPPLLTPPSGSNRCPRYQVQVGDTLSLIAEMYGISLIDLLEVNELEHAQLEVGQEIIIPLGDCVP